MRGGFDNWLRVLNFTKSIAGAFSIGATQTQVGLIGFSTGAWIEFHLNKYDDRESLLSAIDNVEIQGGETHTAAALRTAREDMFTPANGSRNGVPRILVLLTDGIDSRGYSSEEARLTKDSNITIYVVGATDSTDEDELRKYASGPEYYFFVSNFRELDSVVPHLVDNVCMDAAPLPTPNNTTTTTTNPTGFTSTDITDTTIRPTTSGMSCVCTAINFS